MNHADAIDLMSRLVNAGITHKSTEVLGDVTVVAQSADGVSVNVIKQVADAVGTGLSAKATEVIFH